MHGPASLTPVFQGNFGRMFNTDAIPYQDQLFDSYGTTFKINGYLGVRCHTAAMTTSRY